MSSDNVWILCQLIYDFITGNYKSGNMDITYEWTQIGQRVFSANDGLVKILVFKETVANGQVKF